MPAPHPAAFAIPGDITTKTGGYIYESRLLQALRAAGRDVAHIELGAGFPDPSSAEMEEAIAKLAALPATRPVILDGLVFGAIDPAGLALARAPVCAMIHHPLALETGLAPGRARALFETERANLEIAAHVVVPSTHTATILQRDYGVGQERITIAPPGFDRKAAPPVPANVPEQPLILSVGLLAERKGHDILLRALAEVSDLDWCAEIVGKTHDPDVEKHLIRQRDALGLRGRVTFAGCIDEAELAARYASAAIFALATRYEGYGMAFGEALCHGLPIVTCRTGAVPDTVPPEAGVLVAPDDSGAFAEALRGMLADPQHRARTARAAARAGRALPGWSDTARIMGSVLDAIAP